MRRSKKKGPVQSKKISYDGINFASGLEKYTYIALKKAKLFEGYENEFSVLFKLFFELLDAKPCRIIKESPQKVMSRFKTCKIQQKIEFGHVQTCPGLSSG